MAKVQLQSGQILEFNGTPTPQDVDFAVKQMGNSQQQSPSPQQMQQQAASMPTGQQAGQIPVNTNGVVGLGMPTQAAINAGSTLRTELIKEAALKNQELQQQVLKNPITASGEVQTQQAKAENLAQQNFGQTDSMINNLLSSIKGAYAQSAGGGMINGMAGNIASAMHMPDTGLISGLKTTARDSAAAYAKLLTGGSRGVLGMFNRILDTIPHDTTPSPQQAGSAITEMYLTGAAVEKGIKSGGLTPDQLKGMSPEQVQNWVGKNSLSASEQNQIYQAMSTKFQSISPRQPIDMYGNVQPIKPNPLSLFADKAQNFFRNAPSAKMMMKDPDGKLHYVANKDSDDALEHGWTKNE